ncbi:MULTISPECIES: heme ABC transporter ATP-binding protein [Methylomonas]|uniref:Hemin ABC transporter ATP-binding protein n=2 Tax=Methylomonas TaxID=416 RepID=A0A140E4A5_9GAMM|nr:MULTISPECIES: heme ABC transporter ATP-binding protein [Methylomonas]AMK75229.1 hemin ABC transporter ATP-binding protein [Methylomonas denitrificans]OAH99377.1 heme ABC transporter ATP-binding protein [Methylomonas methanica]TCV85023.1 iron complex transport system ATP-binding protein [Methylomonas methanica]
MLTANNITVRIGAKTLLDGVSLALHPGEVLAVIGPNGAGKSTLLRAMSGELTPFSGTIVMNGRPLPEWQPRQTARMRGVLPQNSALAFRFKVLEVVLMGRSPYRKTHTRDRNETIARQALQLTDTGHLAERIYTTLSGGERQRVQLARVLAQIWEPYGELQCYLLLDEPTSALDLAHQHAVLAIARRFADSQSAGVLAILHDLNLAALYADRIAVLHQGRLMSVGTPNRVLISELIQQIFDYPVTIGRHPLYPDCPLLIPHIPRAGGPESWIA